MKIVKKIIDERRVAIVIVAPLNAKPTPRVRGTSAERHDGSSCRILRGNESTCCFFLFFFSTGVHADKINAAQFLFREAVGKTLAANLIYEPQGFAEWRLTSRNLSSHLRRNPRSSSRFMCGPGAACVLTASPGMERPLGPCGPGRPMGPGAPGSPRGPTGPCKTRAVS